VVLVGEITIGFDVIIAWASITRIKKSFYRKRWHPPLIFSLPIYLQVLEKGSRR
jgi:hypothetical protein